VNTFAHPILALWVALCFGSPPAGASPNYLAPPGSAPSHSCIYLYAHANPVNNTDPSGLATEGAGGFTVVSGGIGGLAAHTAGAISRGATWAYVNSGHIVQGAQTTYYWATLALGTAGAVATITPEVLEVLSDLSDSYNRMATKNTHAFPPGGGPRGKLMEEKVFRPSIQQAGGEYLGGGVKGIDGVFARTPGGILTQGKSHDVPDGRLLQTIRQDMQAFSTVEDGPLTGPRSQSVGGGPYLRPAGPAGGKILMIAVPESQARYILSPEFIQAMRTYAQEFRQIPLVRAIRNFTGLRR